MDANLGDSEFGLKTMGRSPPPWPALPVLKMARTPAGFARFLLFREALELRVSVAVVVADAAFGPLGSMMPVRQKELPFHPSNHSLGRYLNGQGFQGGVKSRLIQLSLLFRFCNPLESGRTLERVAKQVHLNPRSSANSALIFAVWVFEFCNPLD